MIVVKETTRNAQYPLHTYLLSDDRMKLHGFKRNGDEWINYGHPLMFNPKGRTFLILKKHQ